MKCINCKKEFIPQRSTAKYCSDKCRISYSRKVSVTEQKEVSVTKETQNAHTRRTFTPNLERNGYKNHRDALYAAIGDVLDSVPGAVLVLGNEVHTNLPKDQVNIKKAQYCPKHGKVRMGGKYQCGCKV